MRVWGSESWGLSPWGCDPAVAEPAPNAVNPMNPVSRAIRSGTVFCIALALLWMVV